VLQDLACGISAANDSARSTSSWRCCGRTRLRRPDTHRLRRGRLRLRRPDTHRLRRGRLRLRRPDTSRLRRGKAG
jgi:hypothetical protein